MRQSMVARRLIRFRFGKANRWSILALLAVVLIACGKSPVPETVSESAGDDSAARLEQIFEGYFEDYLSLNPVVATALGDDRYDDRLEITFSPEYRASEKAQAEYYRDQLLTIDPDTPGAQDRLSRATLLYLLDQSLESLNYPDYLLPLDQMNSFANSFAEMGSGQGIQPFRSAQDYDNFLARVNDFELQVDVAIANLKEGVQRGVVLPRFAVERLIPQLSFQIVDKAGDSVFFGPVNAFPDAMPAAERERLRQAYATAIMEQIMPAYRRLRDFMAVEYLPAARDTVGYSALPDGDAWYDFLVRSYTTTDLSPEQIHQIGLAEVERILGEMDAVRVQVGFEGDLNAFFDYLGSDPGFFWTQGDDALRDYRGVERQVNAALPAMFSVFPNAGFEIRPVEAFRADSAASASYQSPSVDGSRPGVFYLNTHDIARLPRWGMVTLFLHEAIPGHHFQSALAQENMKLPRFRRFRGVTAYTEGWALYSEDLGIEMQMFSDPYQYFGKLNDEMLRALRLVVDTGLHRMNWTRQQAIDYMLENSSLPELEVVPEVERYIVDPGQALSYKIGQLRLHEFRAQAEAALGDRFDLRQWHDMILLSGELPMGLLGQQNEQWIAAQRID
ncbi:MAG: DUF885 domain-containing protein [Gammaproteobacteria bacterium]